MEKLLESDSQNIVSLDQQDLELCSTELHRAKKPSLLKSLMLWTQINQGVYLTVRVIYLVLAFSMLILSAMIYCMARTG